jgi:hypothetical protein
LIPAKAVQDAFHVAIATLNGMDYLLTWNCRHIANAEIIPRLAESCRRAWLRTANDLHAGAVDGKLNICKIRSWRKYVG